MSKLKDIEEILELAKDEIKNNDENVSAILDLQDLKSLKYLYNNYIKLKKDYDRLSSISVEIAFDEQNIDTEILLRVLLKQKQITLKDGMYHRKDFDWEENLMKLGLMKKREKLFYIPDEECLDEYTKQLEAQLKEYQELKKIFKKYNVENETMYDGFCKMQDKLDEKKRQLKIKDEYLKLIGDIAYDYDGCNTVGGLKELIDELVELSNKAVKNDDTSVAYMGANGHDYNILHEVL